MKTSLRVVEGIGDFSTFKTVVGVIVGGDGDTGINGGIIALGVIGALSLLIKVETDNEVRMFCVCVARIIEAMLFEVEILSIQLVNDNTFAFTLEANLDTTLAMAKDAFFVIVNPVDIVARARSTG